MAERGGPTGELGTIQQGLFGSGLASQTLGWQGFIQQAEHVPELIWPESVHWYERMLFTDSQIEGLYLGLMLPLGQYEWALDRNGADAGATAKLAADLGLPVGLSDPTSTDEPPPILPGLYRFDFLQHLSEALLAAPLGHYFFELVGEIGPDEWWHLAKLAPRAPGSLLEIRMWPQGDLIGIRQKISAMQLTSGGGLGVDTLAPPLITADRLAPYVWRGDARAKWLGRPMLRSMYRHWLVKDTLIRIDAINHEKAGGVPVIETDETYQGGSLHDLGQTAMAFRQGEDSGAALPPGAKLVLKALGGTNVVESLRWHDEAMARVWQSMVSQLGQTVTGSRALGITFEQLQDQARVAVAEWVCGTFREQVIEKWWQWNVGATPAGEPRKHPLLVYRPRRGSTDQQGAFALGDNSPKPFGEPVTPPAPAGGGGGPPPVAAGASRPSPQPSTAGAAASQSVGAASGGLTVPMAGQPGALEISPRLPDRPLRRKPYGFEVAAAVDFATMDATYMNVVDAVHEAYKTRWLPQQIEALANAVRDSSGTPKALAKLEAPVVGEEELAQQLFVAAMDGAQGARAELQAQGLEPAAVDEAALHKAAQRQAGATAIEVASGLSLSAARRAVQVGGGKPLAEVADDIRAHLHSLEHTWQRDQLRGAVQGAMNEGRFQAFRPLEDSLRFMASELLDNATCAACAGIDGTEYASLSDLEQDYPGMGGYVDCAGGPRCRGTGVAVSGSEL